MASSHVDKDQTQRAVDTIRMLAVDGVEKANSGHPGMPMGTADFAYVLWTRFLRYNPEAPDWPNRDRFVLSAGHGSMLLYAMLHLTGYDLPLDELKQFRQWESMTPGHPERGCAPGVETTTGPLGQGFANGVGMALAAKMASAHFNTDDHALIDHWVYAIVSDGDLMEGVSAEAASLAGHLGLGNIIYFYDSNQITIEGETDLAFSEDVAKRFESYDWHVVSIDGHDHRAISEALQACQAETSRPSLIVGCTQIGKGSPNKQNTSDVHGAPLGAEEVAATKKALSWPEEPTFHVPDDVRQLFAARAAELRPQYDQWQQQFSEWAHACPDKKELWDRLVSKALPEDLEEQLLAGVGSETNATRSLSGNVIQAAAAAMPGLIGGSADLEPSTKTYIKSSTSVAKDDLTGRNFHFGIREHAMGSLLNGMALYGGCIPFGATFLVFSDYMRPPIRLAALMGLQVVYVFTHDSIFVGEDGPTHQPVEQTAALRTIPNLTVIRPADTVETAMAWAFALRHQDGPTALVLTRQSVPLLHRAEDFCPSTINYGAYVLSDCDGTPDCVVVATGSEVGVAVEAKALLEEAGHSVRIVSMPSMEIFRAQSDEYQNSVIPSDCPVAAVEAGSPMPWYRFTGRDGLVIGMDRFGASAPAKLLAEKFGFTGEQVAAKIQAWLAEK